MKRSDELRSFLASPVGAYLAGRTWFIWCSRSDLAGAVVWGHHSESDAKELVAAMRMTAALATPYDFISDFSRVAAINIAALEILLADVKQQRETYYATTRTSVLVRPSGFASALAAGAFRLYAAATDWRVSGTQEVATTSQPARPGSWRRSWRIVDTTWESFAALDRADLGEVRNSVESILAEEAKADVDIATLRGLFLRVPSITLPQAAKQLGVSERSLQRKLEDAGTNFRSLSSETKLQEAKRLLEGTDEKLTEIARRVGLRSAEQLNKLFRVQLGENPSTIRKRARSEE